MTNSAEGVVVQGHGIASGKHSDDRFPQGSISMQIPFFKKLGLDVSHFFMGTINISFSNFTFELVNPVYYFPKIKWCADLPAENFSFFSCNLNLLDNSPVDAFVYWPHPSTKPAFHQDPSVLEFLAPKLANISYGKKSMSHRIKTVFRLRRRDEIIYSCQFFKKNEFSLFLVVITLTK